MDGNSSGTAHPVNIVDGVTREGDPMHMRTFIALSVAVAAAAAPAYSQTTSGQSAAQTTSGQTSPTVSPLPPEAEGLSFTPYVELGFAGDYDNTPAGFGAALGYGMNNRLAVEADFSFTPGGEQDLFGEFDSTVWSLSGNVLYHFTNDDVTPYVALGLVALGANVDDEDTGLFADDSSTAFAWNWGGGIKTALSERFGFRGDLRYFNGDELAPDHWRIYGGVIFRGLGR
jgi:opacity protein-like surface antigen